ncbi:NlpC/P60 family protein [Nonlabens xylanidelens]|uniref:NlpC/P60 family protein n=1 Tax=Nonlabens xylanidelens TaxID=191564 RepID=A0A2S6ISL0_9FLAO|nr:C40 family peptidase [Nonlabens xylanidelens]PPK97145.1 NlpC/P60 family protein [Nonlabens xylanidelens]
MNVSIPLSRKQDLNKNRSIHIVSFSLLTLLFLGLTSCGSSKPKVVTTKREAARTSIKKEKPATARPARTMIVKTPEKEFSFTEEPDQKPYEESTSFIDEVIDNAMDYKGVKYRYGGTTRKGMDCSGLICTAFKEAGKTVPRTSRSMYATAQEMDLDEVRKGDFLFFATGRNKRQVNHVALITRVTPGEIEFIHSTTSRGVMTSTLNEAYWLNAFLRAGRIE